MTLPKPPADMLALFVLILREHGLIILALGALVGQVYFLSNLAREQQAAWRETLQEIAKEMKADRAERAADTMKLLLGVSTLQETTRNADSRLIEIAQDCQDILISWSNHASAN